MGHQTVLTQRETWATSLPQSTRNGASGARRGRAEARGEVEDLEVASHAQRKSGRVGHPPWRMVSWTPNADNPL
jgi:hypothetical protein